MTSPSSSAISGDPIDLDENVASGAVGSLNTVLEVAVAQLNKIVVRLASQGPLAPFFAGLVYDAEMDKFRPTTEHQLSPMLEAIFTATPQTVADATDYIASWQSLLRVVLQDFEHGGATLQASYAYLFQNVVAAYENVPIPLSLTEAAAVFAIPDDLILSGTGTVVGTADADLFYLGVGDQQVEGVAGSNAYIVGENFGHDVIVDLKPGLSEAEDSIRFAHLNPVDLTFRREGADLIITENGTDNELRVVNEFAGRRTSPLGGSIDPDAQVEIIIFANGTVWDIVDIAWAAKTIPLDSSDTIVGSLEIDVLDGGGGADYLRGGGGGDIYIFGYGYGLDVISDEGGDDPFSDSPDVVQFGPGVGMDDVTFVRVGDDLQITLSDGSVLTIAGQFTRAYTALGDFSWQQIDGFLLDDGSTYSWEQVNEELIEQATSAGDDRLIGYYTADVLDGGAGDDLLDAGAGNDTYIFGRESGRDTIREGFHDIFAIDDDTVQFGDDVTLADLAWIYSGDDLLIHIVGTNDVLTVKDEFSEYLTPIEHFVFADGTSLTIDDIRTDLIDRRLSASAGDDTIIGTDGADVIAGLGGADCLHGGAGDDIYLFARGDGQDVVNDYDGANELHFAAGIAPEDVHVLYLAYSGGTGDLILTIDGSDDRITMPNPSIYGTPTSAFASVLFADGTVWSAADLIALAVDVPAANAEWQGDLYVVEHDVADGFAWPSWGSTFGQERTLILHGVGPDDVVLQRIGDHSRYYYIDGSAAFFIGTDGADAGGFMMYTNDFYMQADRLIFDDGTVWERAELEQHFIDVQYTDGDDVIAGFFGDNTVEAGRGNDFLIGGEGSDTYVYRAGDGFDRIDDRDSYDSADRLVFEDIRSDQVKFVKDPANDADLIIEILSPTPGRITIIGHFTVQSLGDSRLESFVFADGVTLTAAAVDALLAEQSSTDRNDRIVGSYNDDVIAGGLGDDVLIGGDGHDTYVWSLGDGRDRIENIGGDDEQWDTLVLHGVSASAVRVLRSPVSANTLELQMGSAAQSITLVNQTVDYHSDHIGRVVFDDGTVWLPFDLVLLEMGGYASAVTIAGTASAETIIGTPGNDVIDGGAGDDIIDTSQGSDLILFGVGSGHDVLKEGDLRNELPGHLWTDVDTLRLVGLTVDDIVVVRQQWGHAHHDYGHRRNLHRRAAVHRTGGRPSGAGADRVCRWHGLDL